MPHPSDPRALLSPMMRGVLDRRARAGHPALFALPPDQATAAYDAGAGVLDIPPSPLPRVEDRRIPARDGVELPARLFAPASDRPLPVLLFFIPYPFLWALVGAGGVLGPGLALALAAVGSDPGVISWAVRGGGESRGW